MELREWNLIISVILTPSGLSKILYRLTQGGLSEPLIYRAWSSISMTLGAILTSRERERSISSRGNTGKGATAGGPRHIWKPRARWKGKLQPKRQMHSAGLLVHIFAPALCQNLVRGWFCNPQRRKLRLGEVIELVMKVD